MIKRTLVPVMVLLFSMDLFAMLPLEPKVEVYYFHFTRRCTTCNNVERVAKESVLKLFPDQVKAGEITFQSVNLDEKEGKAIGKKIKVEGQSLVIVGAGKKIDLTDKAFMWANGNPEKLTAEIKKAVDGLMN